MLKSLPATFVIITSYVLLTGCYRHKNLNTTDKPLTLTRENFKIMANGIEKSTVVAENYAHVVKQASGLYLLHALWGPWGYSYIENPPSGVKQSELKYIPIGAAVGLINVIVRQPPMPII